MDISWSGHNICVGHGTVAVLLRQSVIAESDHTCVRQDTVQEILRQSVITESEYVLDAAVTPVSGKILFRRY
jgi:hypothetical protein